MSIYTDMIEYIEVHGIGVKELTATPGNPCCLFGVKNEVTPIEMWKGVYNTDDTPELVDLVKKYTPEQTVVEFELRNESSISDHRWVYIYNDFIIKGDPSHAIRLLEEAEKLRIKNEINL